MKSIKSIKGFFKPYVIRANKIVVNKDIKNSKDKSGVYIIRSVKTKAVLYIGFSASNLYKTILRHFQSWDDPRQRRVVYNKFGYEVKILHSSPVRASAWEKFLILKFKPKDNESKINLYSAPEKSEFKKGLTDFEKIFGKITDEEAPF